MAGYIIELYKHIITDSDFMTSVRMEDENIKKKTYLTFGDFDRMTVSKVDSFTGLRYSSKMSRKWIGSRQTILLYEITSDNELFYQDEGNNYGFFIKEKNSKHHKSTELFFGISVFQFSEIGGDDTTEYLRKCRLNILKIIEENREKKIELHASVLGVLGTYGVAVLWATDQYKEVLKLINIIKGTDVSYNNCEGNIFLSIFTIFAKNSLGEKNIHDIDGDAVLQLTLRTKINDKILGIIKNEISEVKFAHSAGEYDLVVYTKVRDLFDKFENENIFDPQHKFYKDNILQTNLKLCEQFESESIEPILWQDIQPTDDNKCDKEKQINIQLLEKIDNQYLGLRDLLFKTFPKTAGMVDSLDLLYIDYHSEIATVSNKMWAKDFAYQFLAIMEVIEINLKKVLEKKVQVSTVNALEDFREILN